VYIATFALRIECKEDGVITAACFAKDGKQRIINLINSSDLFQANQANATFAKQT